MVANEPRPARNKQARTGEVAVPDGEEEEGAKLRQVFVLEEREALEDVALDPEVRVDVERLDHTLQGRTK